MLADLRLAPRALARARAFTALAVCCLALGIGATAAVFSVADAVLLRGLPFPAAARLVDVAPLGRGGGDLGGSGPDFVDWRAAVRRLRIAAYREQGQSARLTDGRPAERLRGVGRHWRTMARRVE